LEYTISFIRHAILKGKAKKLKRNGESSGRMEDMTAGSFENGKVRNTKITGDGLTSRKKLMKNLSYEDRNGWRK
jgi:hypothetical protein